jgi:hypothetical protein
MQQLWQTFCDSRRAAATGTTITGRITDHIIGDRVFFAIFALINVLRSLIRYLIPVRE